MVEKEFKIIDQTGIHARPATLLVQTATRFVSKVNLEYKEKNVNLKSIMGLMSLGIPQGAEIKIVTSGPDEIHAIEAISVLMAEQGLGK